MYYFQIKTCTPQEQASFERQKSIRYNFAYAENGTAINSLAFTLTLLGMMTKEIWIYLDPLPVELNSATIYMTNLIYMYNFV